MGLYPNTAIWAVSLPQAKPLYTGSWMPHSPVLAMAFMTGILAFWSGVMSIDI